MLTVTERAKQELKKALSAHPSGYAAFRMVLSGQRKFDLALDREREGDQVVEHEGCKVLLVSGEIRDALEGSSIDCRETAEGPCLVISSN